MRAAVAVGLLLCSIPGLAQEYYLGQHALRRGDLETAYREFKGAAENGDPVAARVLGMLLSHDTEIKGGQKLEARPEESVKWYRVGAEKGDTISADLLGARLAVGRGVALNAPEALRWLRAAGRDVDKVSATFTTLPAEDRDEIAAWFLALRVVMQYEMKPLRSTGPEGKALLKLHADGPRISVEGNPPAEIVEKVEDFGRRALELAPPPPAAVRRHATSETQVVFK